MRVWLVILTLGAGVGTLCHAAPINRCEFSDGRVIYSDEPCPPGAQRTRTVDEKPAVEVMKSPVNERAQNAKSTGTVRRSQTEGGADSHDPEAASDLRKLQVAECDDLVRRIEYAQHDLNAATGGERSSAELSLRRLQAEHENKCSPHAGR
ncbi:MAG TPA: DUF4124 domain-containing protein [Burkholderiaceae bacterium]|jgi:hypothetical protein|nr:DUF4124 domain-containing protein [Burkholderiaceae bacterium]